MRSMKSLLPSKWAMKSTLTSILILSSPVAYFLKTGKANINHKRLPQTVSVIITAASHVSGAKPAPVESVLQCGSNNDSFDRLPELKCPSAERLRRVTCLPGSSQQNG